jgi:PAP2 superfamily
MQPSHWPHYGYFDPSLIDIIGRGAQGWRKTQVDYEEWRTDITKLLEQSLWPTGFLPIDNSHPATQLTLTDLRLLRVIQLGHGYPPRRAFESTLFRMEDSATRYAVLPDEPPAAGKVTSCSLGEIYVLSNPNSAFAEIEATTRAAKFEEYKNGYKVAPIQFELKRAFQRPRPKCAAYHADKVLHTNFSDVKFYGSHTAHHPSFISGHALQGILYFAYAFWRDETLLRSEVQALSTYAALVGDRRVMAGLHYPSDSLASWIVALKLLPEVLVPSFKEPAMRFSKMAIKNSLVYKTLDENVNSANGGSPYQRGWSALQQLLN